MISSCLPFPCLTRRNRTVHDRPRWTYQQRQESLYNIPEFAPQAQLSPPYAPALFLPPLDPDLPSALIPLPRTDDPLGHHLVHYQPRPIPPVPIPVQPLRDIPYLEPLIDHVHVHPPPIAAPTLQLVPHCESFIDHGHVRTCPLGMAGLRSNPLTNFVRGQEAQDIIDAVVRLVQGTDYYNRNDDIRFGALRSLGGLSDERRIEELMIDDLIRRVNLIVQLTNHTVNPRMTYAEIHPKVSDSGADIGRYPRDFERPRRVEEFYAMDSSVLDRILQSYGLPRDVRVGLPDRFTNGLFPSLRPTALGYNDGARDVKLRILFEFLGVDMGEGRAGGLLGSARLNDRSGLRLLPSY